MTAIAFLWGKKKKRQQVIKIEFVLSFGKTNKKKECLGYLETALVNLPICYKLGVSARYWKIDSFGPQ